MIPVGVILWKPNVNRQTPHMTTIFLFFILGDNIKSKSYEKGVKIPDIRMEQTCHRLMPNDKQKNNESWHFTD